MISFLRQVHRSLVRARLYISVDIQANNNEKICPGGALYARSAETSRCSIAPGVAGARAARGLSRCSVATELVRCTRRMLGSEAYRSFGSANSSLRLRISLDDRWSPANICLRTGFHHSPIGEHSSGTATAEGRSQSRDRRSQQNLLQHGVNPFYPCPEIRAIKCTVFTIIAPYIILSSPLLFHLNLDANLLLDKHLENNEKNCPDGALCVRSVETSGC